MALGRIIRLSRVFGHPSGRFCSVAVDHFIGYAGALPEGLRQIRETLGEIVEGGPDAITMHKGVALHAWQPFAGRIPLIMQGTVATEDDAVFEQLATPDDAMQIGADAFAFSLFLGKQTTASRLRLLAENVRLAAKIEMPLICHIYPLTSDGQKVSYAPEDVGYAVRCALEIGADVIKAPYCGEKKAYAQIVAECPVPMVAAGGPKTRSFEAALAMMSDVVEAGARGATIGRNVWGFGHTVAAIHAFNAVIHDRVTPKQALNAAGL